MNKPEKFDDFLYAVLKVACRFSLVDVCYEYGISEEELDECENWLDRLKGIKSIPEEAEEDSTEQPG